MTQAEGTGSAKGPRLEAAHVEALGLDDSDTALLFSCVAGYVEGKSGELG